MNKVKKLPITYSVVIEDGLGYLDTVSDAMLDFFYIACDLFENVDYEEWTPSNLLERYPERCDIIAKGVAKSYNISAADIFDEMNVIDIGFLGVILQCFAFCREWNIKCDIPRILVKTAMVALGSKLSKRTYHVGITKGKEEGN